MLESLSVSLRVLDLRLVYVATKRRWWEGLSVKTHLPSCAQKKVWVIVAVRKLRR